jgi:hypothetical protein
MATAERRPLVTTDPEAGQQPTTAVYGSDRLAALLAELGYRYVAFNPGA